MEKIEKFSIYNILEGKDDDPPRGARVGQWTDDDELIVQTYPLRDIIDRIVLIGFDFTGAKPMEKKLRTLLATLIKKDESYTNSTIDILSDPNLSNSEKADMIDNNVDEFVQNNTKQFSQYSSYRRR